MADAKVMFDVVCDHVLEHFMLKILKLTRKRVSLEKLANDNYAFEIQPTVSGSLIIFQSTTIIVDS